MKGSQKHWKYFFDKIQISNLKSFRENQELLKSAAAVLRAVLFSVCVLSSGL